MDGLERSLLVRPDPGSGYGASNVRDGFPSGNAVTRRARWGVVLGALAACVALVVTSASIAPEEASPPRTSIPACARYVEYDSAYDVCVTEYARNMSAAGMEAACATASRRDVCRSVWATSALGSASASIERRIEACGADEDCRFDILDHADAGTVDEQIALCMVHVRTYAADCVGHVMERWRLHRPDPAEVARLAARLDAPYSAIIGQWVRTVIDCDHVGECAGDSPIAVACRAFVVDPRACSTAKPPVPGGG